MRFNRYAVSRSIPDLTNAIAQAFRQRSNSSGGSGKPWAKWTAADWSEDAPVQYLSSAGIAYAMPSIMTLSLEGSGAKTAARGLLRRLAAADQAMIAGSDFADLSHEEKDACSGWLTFMTERFADEGSDDIALAYATLMRPKPAS